MIDHIKAKGTVSLQLDDLPDVCDNVQLLVYVKYKGPADLEEEFLFSHGLQTTTTTGCFQMVDQFWKEEEIL